MREVRLERMLPQQIREEMDRLNLLYIPIAPLEFHGPHLPYGTDPLNAYALGLRAAQELGGLLHPTVYLGTEVPRPPEMVKAFGLPEETEVIGMDMPGLSLKSFYMPPEAFRESVRAIVETAIAVGFRRIVLLNGHGAFDQVRVLNELAHEMSFDGIEVIYFIDFDTGNPDDLKAIGHAGQLEASMTMANEPDLVHLEELPPTGPLCCREYAIVDTDTFLCNPAPGFVSRTDPRCGDPAEGVEVMGKVARQLAKALAIEPLRR